MPIRNRPRRVASTSSTTKLFVDDLREVGSLSHDDGKSRSDVLRELVHEALRQRRLRAIGRDEGEDFPRQQYREAVAEGTQLLKQELAELRQQKAGRTVEQTLLEMRALAQQMARLETRDSIGAAEIERDEGDAPPSRMNTAARRVNLREERLRLPAGLGYEQKERLVEKTIPEIDRRLEGGVSREAIFQTIDQSKLRPDPAAYARRLDDLAGAHAAESVDRPISREEYLESQQALLRLCEREPQVSPEIDGLKKSDEPVKRGANVEQRSRLAARLRQGVGQEVLRVSAEQNADFRLFVSLQKEGEREPEVRVAVSSAKVVEMMAKIAASEKLTIRAWAGSSEPEILPGLTKDEAEARERIATFLKHYVDERLRDPETRALNHSAAFREARAAILATITPEALNRSAAGLLRQNESLSAQLRSHQIAPDKFPPPKTMPLSARERTLLFNGRAPDHHTAEMRELRLNIGLSRNARAVRVAGLHDRTLKPSPALEALLRELETRKTPKAVAHFQASVVNDKMNVESRTPIYQLAQRIPPHERTFLYERGETLKKDLAKSLSEVRNESRYGVDKTLEPQARPFGAMPKENRTFRQYLAAMGQIERQLSNDAILGRGITSEKADGKETKAGLTITEARALLPESLQRELRLRARNQAWQALVPEEAFAPRPSPEALRISETAAHIQEELQHRASIAQAARNDFVADKTGAESGQAQRQNQFGNAHPEPSADRQNAAQTENRTLSPNDARRLAELDRYAAQTREDVYRAFEELDAQWRQFESTRTVGQFQSPALSVSDSHAEKDVNLPGMGQHVVRLPEQVFSALTKGQEDRIDAREAPSVNSLSPMFVRSDDEWHFDSLRDVLPHALHPANIEFSARGHIDFDREGVRQR